MDKFHDLVKLAMNGDDDALVALNLMKVDPIPFPILTSIAPDDIASHYEELADIRFTANIMQTRHRD